MKLAVMQPYLFPYIGYFQLIKAVDKFVIYDDVNFIKKGWINRNNILVNGQSSLFTIPLVGMSQNKLINEIEVLDEQKWRLNFLKTIEMSYKKAPFFKIIFPIIENIILTPFKKITDVIIESITQIIRYLNITTEIVISSHLYKLSNFKGQQRILEICNSEKATVYVNPIGGVELYEKDEFVKHCIKLNFIKTYPIKYNQFNNEFVPWLSIIDVLMFNSVDDINLHLNKFALV